MQVEQKKKDLSIEKRKFQIFTLYGLVINTIDWSIGKAEHLRDGYQKQLKQFKDLEIGQSLRSRSQDCQKVISTLTRVKLILKKANERT